MGYPDTVNPFFLIQFYPHIVTIYHFPVKYDNYSLWPVKRTEFFNKTPHETPGGYYGGLHLEAFSMRVIFFDF